MIRTSLLVTAALALTSILSAPPLTAQDEFDGSDIRREVHERDQRVNQLPLDDRLKLRAAEKDAAAQPEVKAALQKRNQAIKDFRAAMRTAMLKKDPSLAPILEKVAIKQD